jgi:hypothetical protein
MFDSQVGTPGMGAPDAATTLSLVSQAHRLVLEQECRLVELAHWSDLHHPDSQAAAEQTLPGAEQGRQFGGDGTPEVLEFAAAEIRRPDGNQLWLRPGVDGRCIRSPAPASGAVATLS